MACLQTDHHIASLAARPGRATGPNGPGGETGNGGSMLSNLTWPTTLPTTPGLPLAAAPGQDWTVASAGTRQRLARRRSRSSAVCRGPSSSACRTNCFTVGLRVSSARRTCTCRIRVPVPRSTCSGSVSGVPKRGKPLADLRGRTCDHHLGLLRQQPGRDTASGQPDPDTTSCAMLPHGHPRAQEAH